MEKRADIGLVGLGVMGQNLALNLAAQGFRVAVYNRSTDIMEEFVSGRAQGKDIVGAVTWRELAAALTPPRQVLLMVKAGAAVDAVIAELLAVLSPGDVIIDGGNSRFQDTDRRSEAVGERGLFYLGVGISGGEEGALRGASIMPGGHLAAWQIAQRPLTAIAAVAADGRPCCTYLGAGGAGHFVKTVHNGIEYGDMQLISEAYSLLRNLVSLEAKATGEVFAAWNQGELESYLVEITADILAMEDAITGKPLVDLILDTAEQKGTGKWTAQEAMDLGVPAPTIAEAVFARALSGLKTERVRAAELLRGPENPGLPRTASPPTAVASAMGPAISTDPAAWIEDIRQGLYMAKICSYAQGFAILRQASQERGWDLTLADVALVWRSGCIIRAGFLGEIAAAFQRNPQLENLLLDPYFAGALARGQGGWRRVVAQAVTVGIPVPGFSSALAYYDGYRSAVLPANLVQAQRDYFGAHTYRRVDKPGYFHTDWTAQVRSTPVD